MGLGRGPLLLLLFAVSCNLPGFDAPKAGYGGIVYRCEVVFDEARSPDNSWAPPRRNRCTTTGPSTLLGPYIMEDPAGNLLSFYVDQIPACTTYIVDACMPRNIEGIAAPGSTAPIYKLEDYLLTGPNQNGDIRTTTANLYLALEERCRIAALVARLRETNGSAPNSDATLVGWATQLAAENRAHAIVLSNPDAVTFGTGAPLPKAFGSQPLHPSPRYCARDGYNDSSFLLNVFQSTTLIHKTNDTVGGVVLVDSKKSSAQVQASRGGSKASQTVSVSGVLVGDIESCTQAGCAFELQHLNIQFLPFKIKGRDVTNATLYLERPIRTSTATQSGGWFKAGDLRPTVQFDVSKLGTRMATFNSTAPTSFVWDGPSNQAKLDADLSAISQGTLLRIKLHLEGAFANRAPTPIPPEHRTVECNRRGGAVTVLDGRRSRDLDGDPIRFEWYLTGDGREVSSHRLPFAIGETVESPLLPPGRHRIKMKVIDRWRWSDEEPAMVLVQDTQPPVLEASLPLCILAPGSDGVLVDLSRDAHATAFDSCDGDLRSSLRVEVDGEPVDTAGGKVCLGGPGRGSRPSIKLSAVDQSGNRAEKTATVVIAGSDASTSCVRNLPRCRRSEGVP